MEPTWDGMLTIDPGSLPADIGEVSVRLPRPADIGVFRGKVLAPCDGSPRFEKNIPCAS